MPCKADSPVVCLTASFPKEGQPGDLSCARITQALSCAARMKKIQNPYPRSHPMPSPFYVLSFFPSFSLPDVLCDPIDHIWRLGTPFEAITGRTAFIDGLLAEGFRGFP